MAFLRIGFAVTAFIFICSLGELSRADDAEQEEELVKEVLFKPETCDRVTKNHDMLTMHYTGTLTATGAKFDSR